MNLIMLLGIASLAGSLGSIPGLGRSSGEGKGYPLQYPGLENSVDYIVHGSCKELDMTEPLSLSRGPVCLSHAYRWLGAIPMKGAYNKLVKNFFMCYRCSSVCLS